MENQFKVGQELSFNVYGNEVKGTYIKMFNSQIVTICVAHDSYGVSEIGSTIVVNLAFLIKDTPEEKNQKFTNEYAEKLALEAFPEKSHGSRNLEIAIENSKIGLVKGYMLALKETAAPELLEALQGLNHLWQGKEDWIEVKRAINAINKATK